MDQSLKDFLARQESPNTKRNYGYSLQKLKEYVGGELPTGNAWVKGYTDWLVSQGCSNKTVNYHLTVAGRFYAYKTGQVLRYDRLKAPPSKVTYFTDEQVKKILAETDATMRASFLFMLDTGVRASEFEEISSRRFQDVPDTILVMGKGQKQRIVVLGEESKSAIRSVYRDGLLFGRVVSVRALQYHLKKIAEYIGLDGDAHPHMFRHTMATKMLSVGANIEEVRVMLGHSHLSTTQIYTHVSDERLRKVWKEYLNR